MFNLNNVILCILMISILFITKVTIASDFSGQWCWDQDSSISAFCLNITKTNRTYNGGYGSVIMSGNIIDDNDNAFHFNITNEAIVQTKLKAGITGNLGIIQLHIIDNKQLEWRILSVPKVEIYIPKKATLHRCKQK